MVDLDKVNWFHFFIYWALAGFAGGILIICIQKLKHGIVRVRDLVPLLICPFAGMVGFVVAIIISIGELLEMYGHKRIW